VGTGGLCLPGCGRDVCSGGLRCWGLCVCNHMPVCRLCVFGVVVRLDSKGKGNGKCKVIPLQARCGPEGR